MGRVKKKRLSAKFLYNKKGGKPSKLILIALPKPYLLNPPINPLLGLAYIASFVKNIANVAAVDFATIDCDYEETGYLKYIPLDGDMYVISCDTPQYGWLKQVSKYLKKFVHATIVAQGQHPTNFPRDCLDYVDVSVAGSGEVAVHRLVLGAPWEVVPGIVYKSEGQFHRTTVRVFETIDRFPFPDREIFDLQRYKSAINGKRAAHIITMRGCPFRCYFCDKATISCVCHFRSVENVMEEIDILRKQGIEAFVIDDKVFTIDHERVRELCKEFKKRRIIWRCQSRTDTITWELLRIMAEAGLANIAYNVDSGDTAILKKVNKGDKQRTLPSSRYAILWAHLARVPVRCNLKYGLPGETIDSLKNTIKLMEETYPDDINLSVFQPVPGSKIWRKPWEFGLELDFEKLRERNYLPTDWFSDKWADDNWVTLDTMTPEEYQQNLQWFVQKLDSVCRRKKIKDTM